MQLIELMLTATFVVIVGINYHIKTNIFMFALLKLQTEYTYTWLLETFLEAINGKHPLIVITKGHKVMKKVVSTKFPDFLAQ